MRLLHAGIDTTVIRALARTSRNHADVHPRRPRAQRTSTRPHQATGQQTRPLPPARRTPRVPGWTVTREAAVDQDLVRGLVGAGIGGSRSQARSVSSDGRSRFWANLRTGCLVAVAPGFPRCRGYRAGRLLRDSGRSGSWRSKRQPSGGELARIVLQHQSLYGPPEPASGLRHQATVVRSRVGPVQSCRRSPCRRQREPGRHRSNIRGRCL
jgi:hypothetical protein